MQWSYNPRVSRTLDQVRLLIGDTDQYDPQLDDGEILFFLTSNNGVVNRAALACAEALQGKYARLVDSKIDDTAENLGGRLSQYTQLVNQLRAKLARGGIRPLMGGQSNSEKRSNRRDWDLPQPAFTVTQFSEPGVFPSTRGEQDNPNNE